MLTVPLLALAALLVVDRAACAEWKYSGEFGPHNWAAVDTSPNINQCGGKFQSPVDFDDRYSEFDPSLGEIRYSGYNEELYNPYIVNNGHTVQVSATENENRYIEGAGLPGRFQFAQFHYHWGSNSSRGAEHTVRGFQYPLELHLVHFNQKYGSLAESLKYNDGLAVLGVFFEVGPTANEDISVIVDALKDVRLSGTRGTNLQRRGLSPPGEQLPADVPAQRSPSVQELLVLGHAAGRGTRGFPFAAELRRGLVRHPHRFRIQ